MNAGFIASENCLYLSVYGENIICGYKMYSGKIWLVGCFFYKLNIGGKLLLSIFQNNTTWRVLFKKITCVDVAHHKKKECVCILQTGIAIFKEVVQRSEQPPCGTSMGRPRARIPPVSTFWTFVLNHRGWKSYYSVACGQPWCLAGGSSGSH